MLPHAPPPGATIGSLTLEEFEEFLKNKDSEKKSTMKVVILLWTYFGEKVCVKTMD